VLSACSTARAEVAAGNEWVGFSRALLHAGASALLASLWEVSDEGTLALFAEFYRGVRRDLAAPAALAGAARALKCRAEFSHPYYWAAFTLVGG
jgi:CHAT domain-containing protein